MSAICSCSSRDAVCQAIVDLLASACCSIYLFALMWWNVGRDVRTCLCQYPSIWRPSDGSRENISSLGIVISLWEYLDTASEMITLKELPPRWCHQMETIPALLALCWGNSPVSGEFPTQRPVTRSFDVFFDLRLNKWLSKHSRRRWFKTPSRSLWRHYTYSCSKSHIHAEIMHSVIKDWYTKSSLAQQRLTDRRKWIKLSNPFLLYFR